MSETIDLRIGYDKTAHPLEYRFQYMDVATAKLLNYGERVWFKAVDGTARGAKVNGKPKTWKTRPGDCRVPIKYGMFECGESMFKDGQYHSGSTLLILDDDSCPFNV